VTSVTWCAHDNTPLAQGSAAGPNSKHKSRFCRRSRSCRRSSRLRTRFCSCRRYRETRRFARFSPRPEQTRLRPRCLLKRSRHVRPPLQRIFFLRPHTPAAAGNSTPWLHTILSASPVCSPSAPPASPSSWADGTPHNYLTLGKYCAGGKFIFANERGRGEEERPPKSNPPSLTCLKKLATLRGF
jgi:hypothetical protein